MGTLAPPTPSPSAPGLGTAWIRIDDADLFQGAQGSMTGIVPVGQGALAWGSVQGEGPTIWRSPDGRTWRAASPEPIDDSWVAEGYFANVSDVIAGGPGYVAVGSYLREHDWTTSVVWTSADGQTWSRAPDGPEFERSSIDRVLSWDDNLLAFGCSLVTPSDCGSAMVWVSTDGGAWTRRPPTLPSGISMLDLLDVTDGRLWAQGVTGEEEVGTEQPTMLSSTDGVTWTASTLRWLAPMHVHAAAKELFATVPPMPTAADGYEIPGWWSRDPGIFRSTDFTTWTRLSALRGGHPQELIAAGDGLLAAGAMGQRCWELSNCRAAGWVSTDGGATWADLPAQASDGRPDDLGGTINAAVVIAGGSVVGVGVRAGGERVAHPAVWLLPAERS